MDYRKWKADMLSQGMEKMAKNLNCSGPVELWAKWQEMGKQPPMYMSVDGKITYRATEENTSIPEVEKRTWWQKVKEKYGL